MTKRIGSPNSPQYDSPDRGCKIATEELQVLAKMLKVVGFAHIESRCLYCPYKICMDDRAETREYLIKVRNRVIRDSFRQGTSKIELKKMFGMGVKNLNNILGDYWKEK